MLYQYTSLYSGDEFAHELHPFVRQNGNFGSEYFAGIDDYRLQGHSDEQQNRYSGQQQHANSAPHDAHDQHDLNQVAKKVVL